MKHTIANIEKGDLIYITAPAKAIEETPVLRAKQRLEQAGFRVEISKHCTGRNHYFSGTEAERLMDLQHGIDREDVKAIICARGGYGSIQLVDKLQWASILRSPKWLVGFSDITVFHQRMQQLGLPSIHATMPLNFEENTSEAIESLIDALQGNPTTHTYTTSSYAKEGIASGKLVGGNLSILYSLLGTDDQIDYTDCILFVEDLSEQLYHIDRMFFALEKAGVLDKIRGLVIGGMTEMKDTPIPIGKTLEQLILDHFQYRKIPIAFSFPAGHIPDNRALVLGQHYTLEITSNQTSLRPSY